MAQYKKKIVKLSKGQIAPELIERTDIGILDSSGQIVHNFQNSKYGLFSTTKSTKFEYAFAGADKVKLFNIETPDGIETILVLNATTKKIFLVRNGAIVSNQMDAPAAITESNYTKIGITQATDLIIVYSRGIMPLYKLQITGNAAPYTMSTSIFAISEEHILKATNISSSATDFKTTTGTIKPSATTGAISVEITGFSLTAPSISGLTPLQYAKNKLKGIWIWADNETGTCIIYDIPNDGYSVSGQTITITKLDVQTIVAFTGTDASTGYTVQLSKQRVFDSDYPGTPSNPEGTTNYPLTALFYQQRLVIAGTNGNTLQIICSVQGSYDDFNDYESTGNLAFQLVIGSTEKEKIQNILLNQGVQIFTDKSEWLLSGEALSQGSGFVRNSQIGSSAVQPIIAANGSTLFTPKDGLGINGFTYTYESASYATPQISLLTNIFDSPIVDMVLRKGYSTTDDTLICLCLANGRLIIGNYLQDQQIQSFVDRSAENVYFRQSIQVDRILYFLVERNGKTLIESESEVFNTACATRNPAYDSETGTISGLSIYNGKNVNVYDGNGKYVETAEVNNGTCVLTISPKPTTISEVGYNIHSRFESNPINVNAETMELYKSILKIGIAVTNRSNTEFVTINGKYGRKKGNLITFVRTNRPARDCRFTIENDVYPIDIMSVEIDYEA